MYLIYTTFKKHDKFIILLINLQVCTMHELAAVVLSSPSGE